MLVEGAAQHDVVGRQAKCEKGALALGVGQLPVANCDPVRQAEKCGRAVRSAVVEVALALDPEGRLVERPGRRKPPLVVEANLRRMKPLAVVGGGTRVLAARRRIVVGGFGNAAEREPILLEPPERLDRQGRPVPIAGNSTEEPVERGPRVSPVAVRGHAAETGVDDVAVAEQATVGRHREATRLERAGPDPGPHERVGLERVGDDVDGPADADRAVR